MRRFGVGFASIVGSFVVYGAHVACGGHALGTRAVPSAPAQVASAAPSASASSGPAPSTSATDGCGCAQPKTQAWFVASGDEKLVIDPVDAQATLEASFGRSGGKRMVVLTGVIRGYRSDVAADRPTTLGLRVSFVEGTTPTAAQLEKGLEAHVSTWGAGSSVAPRVYAVVAKSALSVTATDTLLEIRGTITLKDPATGRSLVLDKLTLRKSGTSLLPERSAVFHP